MKFRIIIFLFFLAIFVFLLLAFLQLGGSVSIEFLSYQVDFPFYIAILFFIVIFLICFGLIKQYYSSKYYCLKLIEKTKLRKSQSIHKKLVSIVGYFLTNNLSPTEKISEIKKLRKISDNQNYQTLLSIEELFLSNENQEQKDRSANQAEGTKSDEWKSDDKFKQLLAKLSKASQLITNLKLSFDSNSNLDDQINKQNKAIIEYIRINVYIRLCSINKSKINYDLFVFNKLFSSLNSNLDNNLVSKILFSSKQDDNFFTISQKYKRTCSDKVLLKWCILLEIINYYLLSQNHQAISAIKKNKQILKDSKLACKIFITLQNPTSLAETETAVLKLIKLFDKSDEANFYYLIYILKAGKEQLASPLLDNYLKLLSKSYTNLEQKGSEDKFGSEYKLIKIQNQNQQIIYLIEQLLGCSNSLQEKYLRKLIAVFSKNNILNI